MVRKATPDVIGTHKKIDPMRALQEEDVAIIQQSKETIKKEVLTPVNTGSVKAVNQLSGKEIKQESNKAGVQTHFVGMEPEAIPQIPVPKEKATFNLSKSILGKLEDMWISIRKMRGDKQISKTDIVEQAIEEAIKEYEAKGEYGKFYRNLESNKTVKQ